jgi:hypothetical protein
MQRHTSELLSRIKNNNFSKKWGIAYPTIGITGMWVVMGMIGGAVPGRVAAKRNVAIR